MLRDIEKVDSYFLMINLIQMIQTNMILVLHIFQNGSEIELKWFRNLFLFIFSEIVGLALFESGRLEYR